MNVFRAQAIKSFRVIIIFILLLTPLESAVAETTRVEMVSTLDFVAEMLEMVKFNLIPPESENLTLIFQPWIKNSSIKIDKRTNFVLLQEGISRADIKSDFVETSQKVDLVWLMLVKEEFYRQLDSKEVNLLNFFHILESDFCKNNYKYPWFESLYSKNTLLNFINVLGEAKNRGTNKKKSFARQDGAIKILYRAIEEGVLNPLSLEASQQLALSVFRANDSVCCTLWVPYDLLISDARAYHSIAGEFEVIAFPRPDGKAVLPKIRFNLWKRKNCSAKLRV
ncbi:MAG: hypothetical protein ACQETH_12615, partial [Candidatus Rifleibacteriota bacterium]